MSSLSIKVARRYGTSLIEAYQPDQLEAVRDALLTFAAFWEESQELSITLSNPAITLKERSAALQEIAQLTRPGDQIFSNFLRLLLENKRLTGIRQISAEFALLVDELKRLLALEISTARPIESSEQQQFEQRLKGEFGSLVSLKYEVEPALLGGMLIRSKDRLLDGSVRGMLERVKSDLLA